MKELWAVIVIENEMEGVVRALCKHRSDAEMFADMWDGTVEHRGPNGHRVCHVCWESGIVRPADCADIESLDRYSRMFVHSVCAKHTNPKEVN